MNFLWILLTAIVINSNSWVYATPTLSEDQSSRPSQSGLSAIEQNTGQQGKRKPGFFSTTIPLHDVDIVLGRPTSNSITMSLMTSHHSSGLITYGATLKNLNKQLSLKLTAHDPKEVKITGLLPDTRYHYQLQVKNKNNDSTLRTGTFSTQRAVNNSFSFAVQADSHLDQNTDTELYAHTLENIKMARPDFLIDLGDTFMTDKYRNDFKEAGDQYIAQRYYFGLIGESVPLFLVLGNHDGETGYRLTQKSGESMTLWANAQRKRYFPTPYPNHFYSGNTLEHDEAGPIEDYYAWEWGNALFIVLDPYWYTTRKSKSIEANWNKTLGADQYEWLTHTLESSRAKFKFVFIHQLVGGIDRNGRGGIEAAHLFEWGGFSTDGKYEFKEKRPEWELPIHDLFVKHQVSVVFHGHDHFFAKQDLDGIVYQLVPQPGHKGDKFPGQAQEYGYHQGKILGGSGYIFVNVLDDETTVSFMKTVTDKNRKYNSDNSYSYKIVNH